MRQLAKLMLFAGLFLFFLAAFCGIGNLNEADKVGVTMAMGTSLFVVLVGFVYLLATRNGDPIGEALASRSRRPDKDASR
jgi:hypothetical protein